MQWIHVLRVYLYGTGEGPGPDASIRLDPDGVDGVGREVADGRQLVVVHELGLPLRQRQLRVRREIDLKTE